MNPLLQKVLGWWLIITLTGITLIDVVALVIGNPYDTVSQWVYNVGQRYPFVYLLIGLAVGHLLFPLIPHNGTHR